MRDSIIYNHSKSVHQTKILDLVKSVLISTRSSRQYYKSTNAGFSLIEMIAVLLMIGILAAIGIPSWTAFLNRQAINKANDAVLSAIQDAQQKAKSMKQSYSVSFQTTSGSVLQSAVYPASAAVSPGTAPTGFWQTLGGTLYIPAGSIILGSNITAANTAATTNTYALTTNNQTITFNNQGVLPNDASIGSGLEIVVASPLGNSKSSPSGTKRCIIINTLLASHIIQKDAGCGN
jgi:prepilin-type N-terminal cleavage/methylation domain-containing protein